MVRAWPHSRSIAATTHGTRNPARSASGPVGGRSPAGDAIWRSPRWRSRAALVVAACSSSGSSGGGSTASTGSPAASTSQAASAGHHARVRRNGIRRHHPDDDRGAWHLPDRRHRSDAVHVGVGLAQQIQLFRSMCNVLAAGDDHRDAGGRQWCHRGQVGSLRQVGWLQAGVLQRMAAVLLRPGQATWRHQGTGQQRIRCTLVGAGCVRDADHRGGGIAFGATLLGSGKLAGRVVQRGTPVVLQCGSALSGVLERDRPACCVLERARADGLEWRKQRLSRRLRRHTAIHSVTCHMPDWWLPRRW